MSSGSDRKLRSFVPIMVVPPAGTDLEDDATEQPIPMSTLWPEEAHEFQQADKLRASVNRERESTCKVGTDAPSCGKSSQAYRTKLSMPRARTRT